VAILAREYLHIERTDDEDPVLPETFKAPHLATSHRENIAHSPTMFHVSLPTLPIRSADGVRRYAEHPGAEILRYAPFYHICWIVTERGPPSYNRLPRIFIHILDDDSLLSIFLHCRPVLIDKNETDELHILRGGHWDRERWWYKLTQVCRRWRCLVLASAFHLDLCILCTYGTPIADVLAHSPPFPLILDFLDEHREITTADEDGILFVLQQQRHRVRRIRLRMFAPTLLKFVVAFDGEFPMLEFLFLRPPNRVKTRLALPKTFQAPNMRHLVLNNFVLPASLLLTLGMGLETFSLMWIPPSVYFHPSEFLQQLPRFPQLKILRIGFQSPVPNRDVESHLLDPDTPIMPHVTLSNLRWFSCTGTSAYVEALVHRLDAPSLEKLQTWFFNQLTYSIPNLVQFTIEKENLRSRMAKIVFSRETALVKMYPDEEDMSRALYTEAFCRNVDWQVSAMVQILQALTPVFSSVEHLTLVFEKHTPSSNGHREVDETQWCRLLRPFSHVTVLQVDLNDKRARELIHALQLVDGESPTDSELLPELKELQYITKRVSGKSFEAFIDARNEAGHPLTLVGVESRLIGG
jgi:hypothetical protein